MVRKLMKYDMLYLFGKLLPIHIIVLSFALFVRIIYFFKNDSTAFTYISGFSLALFIIASLACLVITAVMCIIRYYKGLFSAEGYLSFSLPVTPSQHIISKLFSSFAVSVASGIVIVLAVGIIATYGNLAQKIIDYLKYGFNMLFVDFTGNKYCILAAMVIFVVVYILTEYMLFFTCISIGQLANKRRVLCAFGVFFASYIIRQFFGIILLAVLSADNERIINIIADFFNNHTVLAMYLMFGGLAVLYGILGTVFAFITRFILKKHVNLE